MNRRTSVPPSSIVTIPVAESRVMLPSASPVKWAAAASSSVVVRVVAPWVVTARDARSPVSLLSVIVQRIRI